LFTAVLFRQKSLIIFFGQPYSNFMLRTTFRLLNASSNNKPNVGFIGLGMMGSRMAPNLLKKNAVGNLFIFDANPQAMTSIAKAKICKNVKEVAENSEIIITMLPASKHVSTVYGELFPSLKRPKLFIDASTIDPQTAINLSKLSKERGCSMIDAPVSGGVGGAEAGTLTFMVGGSVADFERARDAVLQYMGKNIVHCGENGMGQVAKISNNLLLASSMTAVSESMLLGTKLGMDPKILANIINTSSGKCWSSEVYNPYPGVVPTAPSSKGYNGGFAAKLMLKDVNLALQAANEKKLELPLGKKTASLYENMIKDASLEDKDFSGIIEYLKKGQQ